MDGFAFVGLLSISVEWRMEVYLVRYSAISARRFANAWKRLPCWAGHSGKENGNEVVDIRIENEQVRQLAGGRATDRSRLH